MADDKNIEKDIEYPSANIMLEISKAEYSREIQRSNTLDNKCSVFMAGIIAIITIFVPLIPFDTIVNTYRGECKADIILLTVALNWLVISVLLFLGAFYYFFKVIIPKPYASVNYNNLAKKGILKKIANEAEMGLIKHYNEIIEENMSINALKAKNATKGFKFSAMAFLLFCVSVIFLQLIIGV